MTELLLIERVIASATTGCLTCSFQAEDIVVLHRAPGPAGNPGSVPGYRLSPDMLPYGDELAASWGVNLVNVTSPLSREQQECRFGPLYHTDPAACCRMRKVEPLFEALGTYSVWFTGLHREQSPTRANLQLEEPSTLPSGHALSKINPLALWQWNEVWSYLRIHEIPYPPLYDYGYTSIGCEPCTTPPSDSANGRSGRWGGAKLECGIHIFASRS
jgi:phosphoadenosine phosphosulfate reductase